MAQIFPQWANRVPVLLLLGLGVVGGAAAAGLWYWGSPEYTDVGYQPEQPIAYSHALHVGELGLDCRYCHSSVEVAAAAVVPPTQVCMNCHQLVGRDLESLEPLYESAASGEPIRWVRVHSLPDYAYFDHSVHVRAGVGCSSCHGDVAAMEKVVQVEPLSMGWCLECHRDPDPHLRPRDQITNTTWVAPPDQHELAREAREQLAILAPEDCSTCHR